MAGPWWQDDASMRVELLNEIGLRDRERLDEICPPTSPGAYLAFLAAPRLVGKLGGELVALGRMAAYAGAAKSLRERVGRYRISLRGLLEPEEVFFAVVPTVSLGAALHAEEVLIDGLTPIFNGTAFGSKNPGARRSGQRISLIDALVSRRSWARQASVVEQAAAQLWLVRRLAHLDPDGPRWPALCTAELPGHPAPVISIGDRQLPQHVGVGRIGERMHPKCIA